MAENKPPFPPYLTRTGARLARTGMRLLEGQWADLVPTRDAINDLERFAEGVGVFSEVTDLAALALLDYGTATRGASVYVESKRARFYLGVLAAPVANQIVTAHGGLLSWYRADSPEWEDETTLYYAPLTGSDEAAGTSVGTAIKTPEELYLRLRGARKPLHLTINVCESDGTLALKIADLYPGSDVDIVALPAAITVLKATLTITAYQAPDPTVAPNGNACEITAALGADTWTTYLYKAVRMTNGPAAGAIAFVCKDMGGADPNKRARLTPFVDSYAAFPTFPNPVNGNTFEIIDLPSTHFPTVREAQNGMSSYTTWPKFRRLNVIGDFNYDIAAHVDGSVNFYCCSFPGDPGNGGGTYTVWGGGVNLYGSIVWGNPGTNEISEFDVFQGTRLTSFATAFVTSFATVYAYGDSSNTWFYKNCLFQSGGQLYVNGASQGHVMYWSNVGVFDSTYATFTVGAFANVMAVDTGAPYQGYVYGTGNAQPILKFANGVRVGYSNVAQLVAAMSAGKPILFIKGATSKDWADLPFVDDAPGHSLSWMIAQT